MASWLLPAVKLILPHVGDIVAAAKPHFTKRKDALPGDDSGNGSVVQQQISELQTAASENTANIKSLAEQLRITVSALEQGASEAETRMKKVQRLATAATVVSVAAIAIAVIALLN
jgi:hypothetical protein